MKCHRFLSWGYANIAKPLFFRLDPEWVHDVVLTLGMWLGRYRITQWCTRWLFSYEDSILEQSLKGIRFTNPIGLAAGFDKNAQLIDILPSIGFGFIEIGSITGEPCEGNPKPRLWRHPEKKSLRVYYGLKNDGCLAISYRIRGKQCAFPVGISVAKTNSCETISVEAGIADYVKAYTAFAGIGVYDTLNISCPNVHGGQPFTDKDRLKKLLQAISEVRHEKPLFIKLSPDLTEKQLHDIANLAVAFSVDGVICSNLTKNHDDGKGGLSGGAVAGLANKQLDVLYKHYGDKLILISCGGIFTAEDIYDRIIRGAHLVQMITGMIYQGPQCIGGLNAGLAKLLRENGFSSLEEARGSKVEGVHAK